jgi:hypothetical protein
MSAIEQAIATLKKIETAVREDSKTTHTIVYLENRITNAVAIYCAQNGINAHNQHVKDFMEELGPYLGLDGEGPYKPADYIDAAKKIREWCDVRDIRIPAAAAELLVHYDTCSVYHKAAADLGRLLPPQMFEPECNGSDCGNKPIDRKRQAGEG